MQCSNINLRQNKPPYINPQSWHWIKSALLVHVLQYRQHFMTHKTHKHSTALVPVQLRHTLAN